MDNLNHYFDEPLINYNSFEGFPNPIDIPARNLQLPVGQPDHLFAVNLHTQYSTGMPTNSQLSLSTADSIADNHALMTNTKSEKERVMFFNQIKIVNALNAKLNAKFLEIEADLSFTPQTETSIVNLESHCAYLQSQKSFLGEESDKLSDIISKLGENSYLFDQLLALELTFNETNSKIALYINKVRYCIARFKFKRFKLQFLTFCKNKGEKGQNLHLTNSRSIKHKAVIQTSIGENRKSKFLGDALILQYGNPMENNGTTVSNFSSVQKPKNSSDNLEDRLNKFKISSYKLEKFIDINPNYVTAVPGIVNKGKTGSMINQGNPGSSTTCSNTNSVAGNPIIQKGTELNDTKIKAAPIVALLGDSWMRRLSEDCLPEYHVLKFCKGGANAAWFSDPDKPQFTKFVREVIELRPDVAIIHMGGNDIKLNCNAQKIAEAIVIVYEQLCSWSIVTFISEIPIRTNCSRSNLSREEYDKIRMLINQTLYNKLARVNFNPIINFPLNESCLMKDGVHLNQYGYYVYVRKLVQIIDSYLNKVK